MINQLDEYGPGCRDIHCVYDPPRRDCVPVFDTDLCCPVRYECGKYSLGQYFKTFSKKEESEESETLEEEGLPSINSINLLFL